MQGTPVSLQAARSLSKEQWKAKVKAASREVLPEGHFATEHALAVTLFYFPAGRVSGDIDNIVKLVLDALAQHIYLDDAQIARVVVQKFQPDNIFPFVSLTPTLIDALEGVKPLLYVRISDDPFEDLK